MNAVLIRYTRKVKYKRAPRRGRATLVGRPSRGGGGGGNAPRESTSEMAKRVKKRAKLGGREEERGREKRDTFGAGV